MTCRKCSESSETISSIQTESQPANAVPPNLESVCESVESEANSLNYFNKLCLSKNIFLATSLVLTSLLEGLGWYQSDHQYPVLQ